jgi:hypothetical protein
MFCIRVLFPFFICFVLLACSQQTTANATSAIEAMEDMESMEALDNSLCGSIGVSSYQCLRLDAARFGYFVPHTQQDVATSNAATNTFENHAIRRLASVSGSHLVPSASKVARDARLDALPSHEWKMVCLGH